MRIISKFKDYYDSGAAFGVDMTQVYVRNSKQVLNDKEIPDSVHKTLELTDDLFHSHQEHLGITTYAFLIGFCGKIIPGLKVTSHTDRYLGTETKVDYCFSQDQLLKVLSESPWYSKEKARYLEKNYYRNISSWDLYFHRRSHCLKYKHIVKVFNRVVPDSNDMFFEFDTPIFSITQWNHKKRESGIKRHVYSTPVLELNPCLKDLGFMKYMDTYTTFQEIAMYKFGVLGSNKDGVSNMSDVVKRDSKGFYDMSFKTRKKVKV